MTRSKGKQAKENSLAERREARPHLESTLDAFRDNNFSPADAYEIISYVEDSAYPIPENLKDRYEGLLDDEHDRVMLAAKDISKGYKKYTAQTAPESNLKNDIGKIFNDKHFRGGNVINDYLRSTQSPILPDNAKNGGQGEENSADASSKISPKQIAAVSTGAAVAALAGHSAIKKWSQKHSSAQETGEKKGGSSSKKAVTFAIVGAVLLGGVGLLANHALAGKLTSVSNSQSR